MKKSNHDVLHQLICHAPSLRKGNILDKIIVSSNELGYTKPMHQHPFCGILYDDNPIR